MGQRLGCFFAALHSRSVYEAVDLHRHEEFESNAVVSRDLVFDLTISPLEGYLQQYDHKDAGELARRVHEDFNQPLDATLKSFVLGDSWTGSVLLDRSVPYGLEVGVIDWEFAGFGSGITGDLAQVLGHLHLHFLAAHDDSNLASCIRSLIASLATSYRSESRRVGAAWASENVGAALPNAATKAMRGALLLVGREMVTNAVDRRVPCRCCINKNTISCGIRKAMVERGVWHRRKACASVVEFCRVGNVQKALSGDTTLRGLFTDL